MAEAELTRLLILTHCFRYLHDPATADLLLQDGGRRFKRNLADQGVGEAAIAEHYSVLGERHALESALAWYRAAGPSVSR